MGMHMPMYNMSCNLAIYMDVKMWLMSLNKKMIKSYMTDMKTRMYIYDIYENTYVHNMYIRINMYYMYILYHRYENTHVHISQI